jgi:hypothetical protein
MNTNKGEHLPLIVEKFLLTSPNSESTKKVIAIRNCIKKSISGTFIESLKNDTLLYSSGPSPIIGVKYKDGKIFLKLYSPIVLFKTIKKYPELIIKENLIEVDGTDTQSIELDSIIIFIISLHQSQVNNKNNTNKNKMSSKSSPNNQYGGKQFKLPRKSASGS